MKIKTCLSMIMKEINITIVPKLVMLIVSAATEISGTTSKRSRRNNIRTKPQVHNMAKTVRETSGLRAKVVYN